ncbi:MAG: IPT/TIG domain-containing protein [Bryobacteraceae bacterium]
MKYFCITLLAAHACLAAAAFQTGQAARLVIGQTSFTQEDTGATNILIGSASGIAFANNTLFVADANRYGAGPINNRVLIFHNLVLPKPTDPLSPGNSVNPTCPVCLGMADVVLGQTDFNKNDVGLTATGLRLPTAVASDGTILAVADTDNNRVLIWKQIPTAMTTPADIVVGQTDFTKNATSAPPNSKSLRGPQGVWIQNGKLFIADTQNNRVLVYNSIPSGNGAAADIVLGQPDFTTLIQPDITQAPVVPKANSLVNPVAVTSDGQRLYVTDLGESRVLIWNNIPVQNGASADVALGQPDLTTGVDNNAASLCPSNGVDINNKPTYPARCGKTLSFPRFALSDGKRLFVADGGNDRILIYSTIPTANGQAADIILGQPDENTNQSSDNADAFETPSSLAWDGSNLYVSDTFNRRILVYSPGEPGLPVSGVRNSASREIFAIGGITVAGTIKENDTITVTIQGKDYLYKILKADTLDSVVTSLVALINASPGDPNVIALPNVDTEGIVLTARQGGSGGTAIAYSVTLSTNAQITATTTGANLAINLEDAAKIAPGTVVSISGSNLNDSDPGVSASFAGSNLPTTLNGTQVYVDGIPVPLIFVSSGQINAQIPYEVVDRTSSSLYIRTQHKDGSVTVTTPVAVSIVSENPGIYAEEGIDPRPGFIYHAFSNAAGAVSVDGSIKAGDSATITIEDRSYSYTVQASDSLQTVRDALIAAINGNPDEKVTASAANLFTRVLLLAKVPGPDGNGIAYSVSQNSTAQLILTALGPNLCCASTAGARVNDDNPAVPGEVLYLLGTGLGLPDPSDLDSGQIVRDNQNPPRTPVDSILAGGKTANVLSVNLLPGTVGVWKVQFQINTDLPTAEATQLTIAQQDFVSNVVTFPVAVPQ